MPSLVEGLAMELDATLWISVENLDFVTGYFAVPQSSALWVLTVAGLIGLISRYVLLPQNSISCFFDGRIDILLPGGSVLVSEATSSRHLDVSLCTTVGCIMISQDFDWDLQCSNSVFVEACLWDTCKLPAGGSASSLAVQLFLASLSLPSGSVA
jgi:hypothetical protein